MRVLVTGGLGFIGRAVVGELYRNGHQITVLTRRQPMVDVPSSVQIVQGELNSPPFVSQFVNAGKFDAICHLAALTGVRDSIARPTCYFDVNVGGTVSLLKAVRALHEDTGQQTRIVFASTRDVYSESFRDPVHESAEKLPRTPYGLSKRVGEQLLDFESQLGVIGAVVLRCFNVSGGAHGVFDADTSRLIPRLVGAISGKLPPAIVRSTATTRDFVHVLDVAQAFCLALDKASPGTWTALNVGSGRAISVQEIIDMLEKATGGPLPAQYLQAAEVGNDSGAVAADIQQAHTVLGWRAERSAESIVGDALSFADSGEPPWLAL